MAKEFARMSKHKRKKFSGVAFSDRQVDNDIKAVLFYVEGDPKSGVIRPYIERPRATPSSNAKA